ncbi:right-handed parallel beta-helix repeat-containing protein [Haloferax sp. DFSO60]|uniref:right-handed parallel beta-helix repeat-containing protein n=1 Tax=Haloferax sp. DFSO60 TaxID=3388652 RepID=UPI003979E1A6
MSVTEINSKFTITQSGTYTLGKDIEHGGGTHLSEACIQINADNVVFDGRGLILGGKGVSDTSGIVAQNVRNVTVKNVTVTRWDYGIRFENVIGGVVENVNADANGYGISFKDTYMAVVRDTNVENNLLGVVFDSLSDATLWNNTIQSNSGRDVFRYPDWLE